ncbi:PhoD-like phosphatase-domain-containing protein [Vararia minispora EC-137]|uniref:PhoD-like phosphatase-domain-containing protein n=1 Tax=Vararia minispora EC-137 TaxID=1314806 RepID=A0ACB8QWE2_9AGAM|nr:PhoD-like phosphatase-domain-containing protein [Vararia minispora EC-137]
MFLLHILGLAGTVSATAHLDRNLAYHSPFENHPQFARDTREIHARHVAHARRQAISAEGFDDQHYPTFYGGDFSNSPFVWSGGVNFTHSGEFLPGDPLDTSVLLWTRAVPLAVAKKGSPVPMQSPESFPICLSYVVFDNVDLSGYPVHSGEAYTSYDVDFTVKVEATGLAPDTQYFFQFADCTDPGSVSPVGKTRTLSNADTPAERVNGGNNLTLAVFSCSQYQAGWFNAYDFAAHNISADVFIHLGDYIYESLGNGAHIGRQTLGRELATIADYRLRLNQYRTDKGLVAAHQNAPWITVWCDDHEVADQSWKAGTANSNDSVIGCSFSPSGACFTDRKLAAVRAYHEWMPIRQVDADDKLRIWRNFKIGKLLDLTMLDTRQYQRDVTDLYYNTAIVINTIKTAESRSLMGPEQETWLNDTLTSSKHRGAVWRVVGQQIVFSQLFEERAFDLDAWDGYQANRARILDHLQAGEIDNTIVLAGDSHANWVFDLAHPNVTSEYDPVTGEGALGVEFAGTAVTSTSPFGAGISPAAADNISTIIVGENPPLQWSEGSYRGFFSLTLNPNTAVATYYAMRNVSFSNTDGFASAVFVVESGANKLSRPVAGGNVQAGVLQSQVNSTA